MKTQDAYVNEKNTFPNPVTEVSTGIPAFVGYTEKALKDSESLLNKPFRITSVEEFRHYFGGSHRTQFEMEKAGCVGDSKISFKGEYYLLTRLNSYNLYYHILQFYSNGGGPCYIVSVGNYQDTLDRKRMQTGIDALLKEQEPSLLVIPEAVCLPDANECYALQRYMLQHCGYKMKSRFAILDIYNGFKDREDTNGDVIAQFREGIGHEFLDFGAAYYPWINSFVNVKDELTFRNLTKIDELQKNLREEISITGKADVKNKEKYLSYIDKLSSDIEENDIMPFHHAFKTISPFYNSVLEEMKRQLKIWPVSAAIAGIYAMVDNTRGVWKAPANVDINGADEVTVKISQEAFEDLNCPENGKSVNAIRYLPQMGIVVWGARTLDGNSVNWRYINVRRTVIMLEQSIKKAALAYTSCPNNANTWAEIKNTIRDFLDGICKRGGLMGRVPEDCYSVHVGLGETMTPEDVLQGIMRITVLVAIIRPAEFIAITFQQEMQKS